MHIDQIWNAAKLAEIYEIPAAHFWQSCAFYSAPRPYLQPYLAKNVRKLIAKQVEIYQIEFSSLTVESQLKGYYLFFLFS